MTARRKQLQLQPRKQIRPIAVFGLALTAVLIVEIGTCPEAGDWDRFGFASRPHGPAAIVSNGAAVFVIGQALVTADLSDPREPTVLSRSYLQFGATVVAPEDRLGLGGLVHKDDYVFVRTKEYGVQVYDVSDPRHPMFAGHLLPYSPDQPIAIELDGNRVSVRGCPPRLYDATAGDRPIEITVCPFPFEGLNPKRLGARQPKECQEGTSAVESDRSSPPARSDAMTDFSQVSGGTTFRENPAFESRRAKIASEDSWYVTACLYLPGMTERSLPATESAGPPTDARRQPPEKARPASPTRPPIEVAQAASASHVYTYSALDLMVNRRASVERYW